MVVGVLRLELLLHAPLSLKEKRSVVKRILGRCRERFPVSCAEVDLHDLWQRAILGFSMVGQTEDESHKVFHRIEEEIERLGSAEIIERFVEFLHY